MALPKKPRRVALVYGSPDTEENSLLTAIQLSQEYGGVVIILCENPMKVRGYLEVVGRAWHVSTSSIRLVKKTKLASLRLFVGSELVLYTHGLVGSPPPGRHRVHINLWHGTAPKVSTSANRSAAVGADAMVGPAGAWLRDKMHSLRMSPTAVEIVGYPRQDMMHMPVTDHQLQTLGIQPERPFVIWAPTYRGNWRISSGAQQDGEPLAAHFADPLVKTMITCANKAGIQILVKAHPHDVESFASLGLPILHSDRVWDAGITLYQLLGRSDGLISDYSSIWVDYLQTRLPIGLYCPDLPQFASSRGLMEPRFDEFASDLLLHDGKSLTNFIERVLGDDRGLQRTITHVHEVLMYDCSPRKTRQLIAAIRALMAAKKVETVWLEPSHE